MTLGAVAGVLLAPKAGKETRGDLLKNIHELPDKARALSDKTQEMMKEAKEIITEKTRKVMYDVKEKGSDITGSIVYQSSQNQCERGNV